MVDPMALAAGQDIATKAIEWSQSRLGKNPILIYSSSEPAVVKKIQNILGRDEAGAMVENALANIATGLIDQGVRRLVVAGGETSGAVVNALEIPALRIGPEIDPGVPWTETLGATKLALALKSGNFGTENFFIKSFGMLS